VLCAAVLHENIEDTETTENEMTTSFGSNVLSVFLEVMDEKLLEIS
jgi:guanosine-3',5'-bis(diphosphate) 3'-pyrophosphohydrolase